MCVAYFFIYFIMSTESYVNIESHTTNTPSPCSLGKSPEENNPDILFSNIPSGAVSSSGCSNDELQYIRSTSYDWEKDINDINIDAGLTFTSCDLETIPDTLNFEEGTSNLSWASDIYADPFISPSPLFGELQGSSLDIKSDTEDRNNKIEIYSSDFECEASLDLDCINFPFDSEESSNGVATLSKIEGNDDFISKRALSQDADGDTFLHILLSKEEKHYNTEQCLYFIGMCIPGKKGLDAINNIGQTALHIACYTENTDVVKALLEHGAEPSLLDSDGNTCLHIACELNSLTSAKCILSTLESKDSKILKDILSVTNSKGFAAIHIATLNANDELLLLLYDFGANVDQQDDCCKKTPLMFACEYGHVKTSRFLLERLYADVNIRTPSEYSALHIASEANNLEIVECLLKNGANLGTKTFYLKTEKDLTSCSKVKVFLERHLRKLRRKKSCEKPLSPDSRTGSKEGQCRY